MARHVDDYTPPSLDDLTLDEAKAMLFRIHKITSGMDCQRSYTPEEVCDFGSEIAFIIERLDE